MVPTLPGSDATIAASRTLLGEMMGSLHRAPAYLQLPPGDQQKMRDNLSRVLGYLDRPPGAPTAGALAAPPRSPPPGQISGNAGKQGVEDFTNLVKAVDFPAFVSGLIEGVFTSIVQSSISQMEAYTKMLEAIVKSVDQFARENFDDDAARTHVQDSFPGLMQLVNNPDDNQPMLAFKDGMDGSGFPDLQQMAGSSEPVQLDSRDSEAQLLRSAKLEMARSKQQMLATMVLMGINRIIITNGQINAKVTFDVDAHEMAERSSDFDYNSKLTDTETSKQGWEYNSSRNSENSGSNKDGDNTSNYKNSGKSSFFMGDVKQKTRTRVSTVDVHSSSEGSESLNLKASLMGEVRLNFKSETFPLEKLADGGGLALLQERAQPKQTVAPGRGVPGAAPAAPPSAAPAASPPPPTPTPAR